ncbi:MAG: polysaccharide biosynthesis/export family protein, partial [Gammaproteobacteria bacterium]|nr:polysaccharide biosynthesis/export family protein [Gammaproteobacteria bacterium]
MSPGDRLQIDIVDGEPFNGRYEVDVDGALKLPYLPPLPVAGIDVAKLEENLSSTLVRAEYFKPERIKVSVRVHEWSHAQVYVSGEVFNPGQVTINARNSEERALKQHLANGDFPSERLLDAALRAAGGVRPGAAIDRIQLL